MSDIFEDVVKSWLQTRGYFLMNNIKYGHNQEIDILAIKPNANKVTHIEVSCSSNPQNIYGGDRKTYGNRLPPSENQVIESAIKYIEKKFLNEKVAKKIKELTNNDVEIERWFIHAKSKDERQKDIFKERGIKTLHIKEVIGEIESSELRTFIGDKRLKQLFDIIRGP